MINIWIMYSWLASRFPGFHPQTGDANDFLKKKQFRKSPGKQAFGLSVNRYGVTDQDTRDPGDLVWSCASPRVGSNFLAPW